MDVFKQTRLIPYGLTNGKKSTVTFAFKLNLILKGIDSDCINTRCIATHRKQADAQKQVELIWRIFIKV